MDAFFVAFTKGKCFVRKFLVFFSCLIVVVTLILVVAIFLHVWRLPYVQIEVFGISNSTVHWIGWIGTIYVAFATPFYPVIKRRFPLYLKKILNIHVLGNLLGVLLVSIHFAIQVTRPADNYPHLGTGNRTIRSNDSPLINRIPHDITCKAQILKTNTLPSRSIRNNILHSNNNTHNTRRNTGAVIHVIVSVCLFLLSSLCLVSSLAIFGIRLLTMLRILLPVSNFVLTQFCDLAIFSI